MNRICVISVLVLQAVLMIDSRCGVSQQPSAPGVEQRPVQLAERDRLAAQAIAEFKEGEFDKAIKLLDRVYEIERSVFGEAHAELIGTLRTQGQVAHAATAWGEEIKFRQKALVIGKSVHEPGHYKLRDLELEIKEAIANVDRTEEQREKLKEAKAVSQKALELFRGGQLSIAIAIADQARGIYEEVLGPKHPKYADSLIKLGIVYRSSGDVQQAEKLFRETVAIRSKALGQEHPSYAKSLSTLADLYRLMGDYKRAEPLLLQSKTINEKVFGSVDRNYAKSLEELASLYRAMGDYARAEPLCLESISITEKVFGREHPSYANRLSELADLYRSMGENDRAEPLFLKSISITEKVFGKEHPNYATALSSLARLYVAMGDYERAEPLFMEVRSVLHKVLGEKHPVYARTLRELGNLYQATGDYMRAEPLFMEAQSVQQKTLGEKNRDYAITLTSLANLYQAMGENGRAVTLYVKSLSITEDIYGNEHPEYAIILSNLAVAFHKQGEFERAERMLQQSKSIFENARLLDHPGFANILNSLGFLYESAGEHARAEPLLLKSKAIIGKVLGKEHPHYANTLNTLALVYESNDKPRQAVQLLLEAKAIRERVLGKKHPEYANSLSNLAAIYSDLHNYKDAESLSRESKSIVEEALGKEHPSYAFVLGNLAGLYYRRGDFSRAASLYLESIDVTLQLLNRASLFQSEQQQMAMIAAHRNRLDSYLRCCIKGELDPSELIERLLLWKGAILTRSRELRLAADDPVIAEQFQQLQLVARQLSATAQNIPGPTQLKAWRKRLDSLVERQRSLEAELAHRSAVFRQANRKITLAEIRQAIPENGVLIDYLVYRVKRKESLVATIIRRHGELKLIDLGSAEHLGTTIDTWRKSFGTATEAVAAGAELRSQLWEPLLPEIESAELVLVSTDGVLGRLPMAALPGREPGTYLIEDHRITMIPVPQLLPALTGEKESRTPARELLLVGDVDYETTTNVSSNPLLKSNERRKRPWERSAPVRGDKRWDSLDETRAEIEFIGGLYRRLYQPKRDAVVDLRGTAATESAFLNHAPESVFIHLATHGFFADPDSKSALSADALDDHLSTKSFGYPRNVVRGYSPGQLSGLVFAGANRPPKSNWSNRAAPDDGILTADEIAYLQLGGTRLVVLSACETGLGEVAGGEGLLGIQRGFQVAGARSTIATLWKVNDAATRRIMQEFYTNYLDKEMSVLDALREAQLWALRNPEDIPRGAVRLRRAEAEQKSKRLSPQHWSPFTLSGDWR